MKNNFNTSNVTIQPRTASPSSSAIDISIHLMLLFNAHPFRLIFLLPYFNTSNVTIQLDNVQKTLQASIFQYI